MKQTIRKTSIVIGYVSYSDGDFTKNLLASDISIEVADDRVVLSFDLSPNQTRGSEGSNSYLDAQQLKTKFARLKEMRLDRNKWLDDRLRDALRGLQSLPAFEIEMHFKDGSVRRSPATLETDNLSLWIRPIHVDPAPQVRTTAPAQE